MFYVFLLNLVLERSEYRPTNRKRPLCLHKTLSVRKINVIKRQNIIKK